MRRTDLFLLLIPRFMISRACAANASEVAPFPFPSQLKLFISAVARIARYNSTRLIAFNYLSLCARPEAELPFSVLQTRLVVLDLELLFLIAPETSIRRESDGTRVMKI